MSFSVSHSFGCVQCQCSGGGSTLVGMSLACYGTVGCGEQWEHPGTPLD